LKIIHITPAYKPAYIYGGPTMSVAKLCEVLEQNEVQAAKNKDNFKVEVLTTTANGKKELGLKENESKIVEGVKVTYFKRLTKDHTHFSPALLKALRNEILNHAQNNKNLIIHIHAWWNLVSVLSCCIAKWYSIPVVLSPRGMLTSYTANNRNSTVKHIIHDIIGKRLLKYCHIHATSEKEKKDIIRFCEPKSITVIANLVSLQQQHSIGKIILQPNQLTSEHLPYKLIFLSRIEEKKGLELLFEGLAKLRFEWTFTIAGSGEENYISKLKCKAESLKIHKRISWVGQVTDNNKFNLLAKHDLMVLTSHNENFANVVVESLSVGTSILISDQVGLADYVLEKDFGWITPLNIKSIYEKLNQSYFNNNKRQHIRTSAPQLINEDFNSQTLVKEYINLYKDLKINVG
jgi:glycosyltransferase involved in cell wall biosynthesis